MALQRGTYNNNHQQNNNGNDNFYGCIIGIIALLSIYIGYHISYYMFSGFILVAIMTIIFTAVIMALIVYGIDYLKDHIKGMKKGNNNNNEINSIIDTNKFHLLVGTSTGKLAERNHTTSIAPNQNIVFELADACQNVLVLGGIGSGKTTRVIQPFLYQILQQDCGGLIFDIKGDFGMAVEKIARAAGNIEIKTIGVHKQGINLLKGLSPEISATFLKSAFYLNGGSASSDSFWIDTATELCKNALGVLSFLPENYSLVSLYDYCFRDEKRKEFTRTAREKIILMSKDDINKSEKMERLLESYAGYYDNIFSNFDTKVIQGVLASVSQVLSPFQHPDLIDTFCVESSDNANIEDILNGSIFLVDLPLSQWGIGGKVIYTFIKLRFFNIMQSRQSNHQLNQDRPVIFICDEYQEIISASKIGLSDLNFWDKSRSAKCIGMISSQSISSFKAAIGDEILADTILQNFRQKICFRTEDERTIFYLNKICGKVEVERFSYSTSTSTSKSNSDGKSGTGKSKSSNESRAVVERDPVDAQLIRQLQTNYAVGLFNIDGQAYDDVICLKPLFV